MLYTYVCARVGVSEGRLGVDFEVRLGFALGILASRLGCWWSLWGHFWVFWVSKSGHWMAAGRFYRQSLFGRRFGTKCGRYWVPFWGRILQDVTYIASSFLLSSFVPLWRPKLQRFRVFCYPWGLSCFWGRLWRSFLDTFLFFCISVFQAIFGTPAGTANNCFFGAVSKVGSPFTGHGVWTKTRLPAPLLPKTGVFRRREHVFEDGAG